MQLPGGVLTKNGEINRHFSFKVITGYVEVALAELSHSHDALPLKITHVLLQTLAAIAGQIPHWQLIHGLCIADRQFLMCQLAIVLEKDTRWYTTHCQHCEKPFDYAVTFSQLPVQQSKGNYPYAQIKLSLGTCLLRMPNAYDQEKLMHMHDADKAIRYLAQRCILQINNSEKISQQQLNQLTTVDIDLVEKMLDGVSPQMVKDISINCPWCEHQQKAALNFYQQADNASYKIYADVLQLAMTCHWSEQAILAMPRSRRHLYLATIDNSHG